MSTSLNNLKNSMDLSWRTAQKKDFNLIKPKTRKRKLKNKKLLLKDYANFARKFLLKKSRKFKLVKDSQIHPVP